MVTRKQAVKRAIEILDSLNENEEIIAKLQEIHDITLINRWGKETIIDSVKQFYVEHGRLPFAREFCPKYQLPPHTVIKNIFKVGILEFKNTYFSDLIEAPKCNSLNYGSGTADFWLEDFKCKYFELNFPNKNDYNKKRNKGSPSVYSLLKILNLNSWSELLQKANINNNNRVRKLSRNYPELTMESEHKSISIDNRKELKHKLENVLNELKHIY